jgi:hypothetical protein
MIPIWLLMSIGKKAPNYLIQKIKKTVTLILN